MPVTFLLFPESLNIPFDHLPLIFHANADAGIFGTSTSRISESETATADIAKRV
jgi:hypothetical protein